MNFPYPPKYLGGNEKVVDTLAGRVYPYVMTNTLVDFVKQYASDHYEDGGWDVIVECWDDDDIADYLSTFLAVTEAEAVAAFEAGVVGIWADRQADARIEGAI